MADSLFYLAEATNHRTSSAGDAENGDSDADESFYKSNVDDLDDISIDIDNPQEELLGEASDARPKSLEAVHRHSTPWQLDGQSTINKSALPPFTLCDEEKVHRTQFQRDLKHLSHDVTGLKTGIHMNDFDEQWKARRW